MCWHSAPAAALVVCWQRRVVSAASEAALHTAQICAMDPEALLNLTFSPQLESALAEVLPSDDPLDAADFDPVAYMNAKFPTEESLGSIDAFCDELDARSKSLN